MEEMEPDPTLVIKAIGRNIKQVVPKFNERQLDRLSEVFSNIGLIFFASMVVPIFTDQSNILLMMIGFVTSLSFWIGSIYLIRSK